MSEKFEENMQTVTLEEIPSFHPTEEEFNDPIDYLSQAHIMKNGMKYGMIKLIPPENFKNQLIRSKGPGDESQKSDQNSIMEADKFKFRIRQQNLSQLSLLNRCRLSFAKQLESFQLMMEDKRETMLPYKMVYGKAQRVYFYDLYISIIRYHNNMDTSLIHQRHLKNGSNYVRPLSANSKNIHGTPPRDSKRRKLNDENVHSEILEFCDSGNLQIPSIREEFLQYSTKQNSFWHKIVKNLISIDPNTEHGQTQEMIKELYDTYEQNIKQYLQFVHKYQSLLLSSTNGQNGNFPNKQNHFKSNGISILQHNPERYQNFEFCAVCDEELENYSFKSIKKRSTRSSETNDYLTCRYCHLNYHNGCTMNLSENTLKYGYVCENCLFGNGCYGFEESETMVSLQKFKTDFCFLPENDLDKADNFDLEIRKLEHEFWQHVNDIDSKLNVYYGADIHNEEPGSISGFENEDLLFLSKHPMNLMNLPHSKGSLLNNLDKTISGMTVPWIYIGSKFSTFCWHLEDQYTLSCNYQFEGAPKIWYSIPPGYVDQFNALVKNIAPDYLIQKQPDLLHQLITLISPYDHIMKNSRIQVYKAIQKPGEFIITYPKCYHAGFNAGYNFNEAVNFTLNSWIPFGLEALTHYKFTNRKCVFDMWELIWKILDIATSSQKKRSTRITIDNYLLTTCYYELLKFFNQSQKNYYQISNYLNEPGSYLTPRDNNRYESGVEMGYSEALDSEDETKDNQYGDFDGEAEEEPVCSRCKTICSFFFVVEQNNHLMKKKHFRYLDQLLAESSHENADFTITCLDDYISRIPAEENSKQNSSHRLLSKSLGRRTLTKSYHEGDAEDYIYKSEDAHPASYTTLYFTKSFVDINKVLKKAEHLI